MKPTTNEDEIPSRTGGRGRRTRALPASGAGDPPSEPTCSACGSVFESHTAKTTACTVCTRYKSIVSNAQRVRRDGSAPGVTMTLEEFATWMQQHDRACAYCEIDEKRLAKLGLKTQVGLPLQRLGVDRVRDSEGYSTGNIVWCCFGCNKAKSNTFSHEEMRLLGVTVRQVWEARLELAKSGPVCVPEGLGGAR